tara:strand:- start:15571 stop:16278 length:708 start_codon:yes stop_codon:yes gene_type:complete
MSENVDNKPKKRGRKKKFETTPFKNNTIEESNDVIPVKETQTIISDNYKTNNLKFGNIFIEVHDKETSETNISDFFVNSTNDNCRITVSSDEEDNCNFKPDTTKKLTLYNKDNKKGIKHNLKCYNCHHFFNDKPFYLPIDYCTKTNRYKLFGNFCSPNCVKSYCINDRIFQHKSHLVGQFYRKLFGYDFKITPAPSILNLKDYGGTLTIEEFRKSFYNNSRYTLLNLSSKVVYFS